MKMEYSQRVVIGASLVVATALSFYLVRHSHGRRARDLMNRFRGQQRSLLDECAILREKIIQGYKENPSIVYPQI